VLLPVFSVMESLSVLYAIVSPGRTPQFHVVRK